jgi:two-component system cell cycle sensor histidine kinase/response regulator CckA
MSSKAPVTSEEHAGNNFDALSTLGAAGELARNYKFLLQIFENTPVAVAVVNREGLFIRINPQFQHEYGYAPEEILRQHYSIIYASKEEEERIIAELRRKGQVIGRRAYFRHQSGRIIPTRISIRKLWGENSELMGSVAVGRNISEEVSLQRQLEQAQKLEAVATLSGGLAHNFNNQLAVILGLTNLMLARITPDHDLYRDLKEIEQQAKAGQDLTRELLTFTRAAAFELRPLDLNELVRATVEMFARTHRSLTLRQNLAPGLLPVVADPVQLRQVLLNFLINAWQAMPGRGEIVIATGAVTLTAWTDPAWNLKPGTCATLSVADQGTGMDAAVLSRIFEPFFTTKNPGQGTGLGLASAYRIIKSHGGAIQVNSIPGKGSIFTVYLPLSAARLQIFPAADPGLISGQATILLVDDEPVLRQVCARLLAKLGYRVLEAPGGEEALELYRSEARSIDLVLLDVIMPGLSGLETLDRLRELNPEVRVLLCSGYGDRAGGELPPEVGFLAKPYTLELLSQKVAAALKG